MLNRANRKLNDVGMAEKVHAANKQNSTQSMSFQALKELVLLSPHDLHEDGDAFLLRRLN